MFIGVYESDRDYHVYECDDYQVKFTGTFDSSEEESGPFEQYQISMFTRGELGDIERVVRTNVDNKSCNVFVMNENGQTIDRIIKMK